MDTFFAVVQWEDDYCSVINLKTVVEPRKALNLYAEKEDIRAPFGGKVYKASIIHISGKTFYHS